MATEVATAASQGSGSLAAVGNSLAGLGTAGKAFVLANPTTMALAGGVVLGLGTYYALGKVFRKKAPSPTEMTPNPA